LSDDLTDDGVGLPEVREVDDAREETVKLLYATLAKCRLKAQGKKRVVSRLRTGKGTRRAQERKLKAATKHEINAIVE
jgi:hypothetical protein